MTTADRGPALICRDFAIQPHGCTCQHDHGTAIVKPRETE